MDEPAGTRLLRTTDSGKPFLSPAAKRLKTAALIVLDEISMMRAPELDVVVTDPLGSCTTWKLPR
jgi:hypothetical protein